MKKECRKVESLSYYSLGLMDVAKRTGLSPNKCVAVVRALKIQGDSESFRAFKIGTSTIKRYSNRAVEKIRVALKEMDIEEIWAAYKPKGRRPARRSVKPTTN